MLIYLSTFAIVRLLQFLILILARTTRHRDYRVTKISSLFISCRDIRPRPRQLGGLVEGLRPGKLGLKSLLLLAGDELGKFAGKNKFTSKTIIWQFLKNLYLSLS